MYVSLSINVRSTHLPKSVINGNMYTITSRRTILGFHRTNYNDNVDRSCTKTELLFFQLEDDAKKLAKIMETIQGRIVRFDRDIDFTDTNRAVLKNVQEFNNFGRPVDSLKPLAIEMVPYRRIIWIKWIKSHITFSMTL